MDTISLTLIIFLRASAVKKCTEADCVSGEETFTTNRTFFRCTFLVRNTNYLLLWVAYIVLTISSALFLFILFCILLYSGRSGQHFCLNIRRNILG